MKVSRGEHRGEVTLGAETRRLCVADTFPGVTKESEITQSL